MTGLELHERWPWGSRERKGGEEGAGACAGFGERGR
jgi:hypothetical protein